MDKIFSPSSIVVIGVSDKRDNLARNIVGNLIEFNYPGQLYLVGRQRGQLNGLPIAASLDEIPDGIDLAVMLVPAPTVPDLVEACGRKGILRVVIESGGFGEFGGEGEALQARVLEAARKWGIRLVGPNGLSVVNLWQGVCLPFTPLSRSGARPGHVGVLAQSGGVSLSFIDALNASGLGTSKVVSMGNKMDLNEIDYLTYLLADAQTHVICMYLESLANGRALFDLARRSRKPILLYKANVYESSARIARSHTAALANDERIVSAAAAQAGIVRCAGLRQTVECVKAFALPPVRGRNLIIFARSGGHAVIAADAAAAHGFRLVPFDSDFLERARRTFRADVLDPTNPLDLGLIFDFDVCGHLLHEALATTRPDAVLYVHGRTSPAEDAGSLRLVQTMARLSRQFDIPVAACVCGAPQIVLEYQRQVEWPLFSDIDDAVHALAVSRDFYAAQQANHSGDSTVEHLPAYDNPAVQRIVAGATGELSAARALELASACGLAVAEWGVAANALEARQVAARLGYPLAVKILAAGVSHKSDVGGVVVDVADETMLTQIVQDMLERVSRLARVEGVLLQRMARGYQVILGGRRDPSFGPVVMFGLGGIYAELFADVSFRLAPITRRDAQMMIDETKAGRLLRGLRGQPPADLDAVVNSLLGISRLMCDMPQIAELDINPLVVSERGAVVVDARVGLM